MGYFEQSMGPEVPPICLHREKNPYQSLREFPSWCIIRLLSKSTWNSRLGLKTMGENFTTSICSEPLRSSCTEASFVTKSFGSGCRFHCRRTAGLFLLHEQFVGFRLITVVRTCGCSCLSNSGSPRRCRSETCHSETLRRLLEERTKSDQKLMNKDGRVDKETRRENYNFSSSKRHLHRGIHE